MKYVKKTELLDYIQSVAPFETAESWDNVGMLVDLGAKEFKRVLFALDAEPEVIQRAASLGCDLLITHHPLFFNGIKHIRTDEYEGRAAIELVKNGISMLACHTNWDTAQGGVNDVLAEAAGLINVEKAGMARIGELQTPVPLREFAADVKRRLKSENVCYAGNGDKPVQKIGLCGGSAMCLLGELEGIDAYLTGEAKHYQGLAAQCGVTPALVIAGHAETERLSMLALFNGLQSRFNNVQYNTEFICPDAARAPFKAV